MSDFAKFAPAPEKPHEKYRNLGQCIDLLYEATGRKSALEIGKASADSGFESYLSTSGFRKFTPLNCSSTCAVVETTQKQVLRLRRNILERDRASRVAVIEGLQPIQERTYKNIIFEAMNKLNTSVTEEEEIQLARHLEDSKEYVLQDFQSNKGDLGYLPDGTIIAVDKDAIYEPDYKILDPALDAPWIVPSQLQSIFPYLRGSGYISKQEHFFPAIRDGRVRGILSDADIERLGRGELEILRSEKPECFTGVTAANLDEFAHLVKDKGWYPSQAQTIMRQPPNIGKKGPGPG